MTTVNVSNAAKQKLIGDYIKTPQGRQKLAASMTQPLRTRRDYMSVGRKTFLVEELPDGALPIYDKDPDVTAYVVGEEGENILAITKPRRVIFPLFEIASNPEIPLTQIKERRFDLIERAQDRAPTTLVCRLPYDEPLFIALTAAGLPFETVEMHTAADGNMMQVVNLPGTLAAIAPELTDRLDGVAPWQGRVRFVLPGQVATLEVKADTVRLTDDVSLDVELVASQADFIQWLLGIVSFTESPQAAALTVAQRLTLGLLFPRCACASGPWG